MNNDGRTDIVGFGDAGVWVSLYQANGTYAIPVLALEAFGYDAGGWRVDRHPRTLADVDGDGLLDIVGFGDAGVWVSLNQGAGTFADPTPAIENFGYDAGGWRVESHPRFLADMNNDGRADIIGFGYAAVYISFGQSNGTFADPVLGIEDFGYGAGSWRVDRHPRLLADVDGDRRFDVIGFSDAGTYVSLQPVHNLRISRFRTSALTNAEAERIVGDATAVLQVSNGPTDVACNVAFTRAGHVGTFNTGNGIINTGADFSTIVALPGDVKIVNAINWCGLPGFGIIGCAPVPGGSFVAVRFSASLEGILWTHEFGHNQGLPHRIGNNFVMNPFITATAREVNAAECAAYRDRDTAEALMMSAAARAREEEVSLTGVTVAAVQPDLGIEEFVRRFYVHGVPYNEARRFGPSAIPRLQAMLDDANQKPYWPNIVGVLGIIGDESVAQVLIDLIERNRDKALDGETYRAALSAPIALGYLANRTSERALNYLANASETLASASPAEARAAGELRLDAGSIGQSAVLGLALSGRPQARQILERLIQSTSQRSPQTAAANVPIQSLLAEALTTLKAVEERGLSEYYRRQ